MTTILRTAAITISLVGMAQLQAATITWGTVQSGIQVGDLITEGNPVLAINAGNDPETATIGDNVFTTSLIDSVVGPGISVGTIVDPNFYSLESGNSNLDRILDSHSYILSGNPMGRGEIVLPNLTPGNSYQVQFIAVADDRTCCSTRSQTVDDGNGNFSNTLLRGTGDWVVGSFVADSLEQSIFVAGINDPGFSALVVRDTSAVPEPSSACLSLVALLGMILRKRS